MAKLLCGIFAITNNDKAAYNTYLGLYAQQHRGHDGAGICDSSMNLVKGKGLVTKIFTDEKLQIFNKSVRYKF